MAVFLTFLLSPLVTFLQRHHVPRLVAVLGVMLVTALVLGGLIWLITAQATALLARLPRYNENVQAKIRPLSERVGVINRNVNAVFGPRRGEPHPDEQAELPPVVVKDGTPPWIASLLPAAHGLAGTALAVVLTGFMLLKREDLRNRLIRLAGRSNVSRATRALDDTGHRVSRFLIMQAILNASTGAVIGLGLLLMRVEYALLWGFLIFVLRYVPYVGIWVAALPPVLISLATSDGWAQPLMVVGLIAAVELTVANVLE